MSTLCVVDDTGITKCIKSNVVNYASQEITQ